MLGGNYNISFALRMVHSQFTSELARSSALISRARLSQNLMAKQAIGLDQEARRGMVLTRAEMVRTTMAAAGLTTAFSMAYRALTYVTKAAGGFQYETKALGLLMGKNSQVAVDMYDNFRKVNPLIKEFASVDVMGTMRRLIQAGYSAADAAKNTGAILNAVTASFGELTLHTAEELGINLDKAFGTAGKSMGDLLDVAQSASNAFSMSTGQIASAMSYATEAATQYDQSLNDTLISIGLLMPIVKQAGKAGTGFRASLMNLTNPTTVKFLEKHNVAIKDHAGNLRSVLDVYADLLHVMTKLEKTDKSKLGIMRQEAQRAVGGVRGGALFTALERIGENFEGSGALKGMQFDSPEAYLEATRVGVNKSFGALDEFANGIRNTSALLDARLNTALDRAAEAIGNSFMPASLALREQFTRMAETLASMLKEGAFPKMLNLVGGGITGLIRTLMYPMLVAMGAKGLGTLYNLAGAGRQGVPGFGTVTPHALTGYKPLPGQRSASAEAYSVALRQQVDEQMRGMKFANQEDEETFRRNTRRKLQRQFMQELQQGDPKSRPRAITSTALANLGLSGKAGVAGIADKMSKGLEEQAKLAAARLGAKFGPEIGSGQAKRKLTKADLEAIAKTSHGDKAIRALADSMRRGNINIKGETTDELIKSLTARSGDLSMDRAGVISGTAKKSMWESMFPKFDESGAEISKFSRVISFAGNALTVISAGYGLFTAAVDTFRDAVREEWKIVEAEERMRSHATKSVKLASAGAEAALELFTNKGGISKDKMRDMYYQGYGPEAALFVSAIRSGKTPVMAAKEQRRIGMDALKNQYQLASPEVYDKVMEQAERDYDTYEEMVATQLQPKYDKALRDQAVKAGDVGTVAALDAMMRQSFLRPDYLNPNYQRMSLNGEVEQTALDLIEAKRIWNAIPENERDTLRGNDATSQPGMFSQGRSAYVGTKYKSEAARRAKEQLDAAQEKAWALIASEQVDKEKFNEFVARGVRSSTVDGDRYLDNLFGVLGGALRKTFDSPGNVMRESAKGPAYALAIAKSQDDSLKTIVADLKKISSAIENVDINKLRSEALAATSEGDFNFMTRPFGMVSHGIHSLFGG